MKKTLLKFLCLTLSAILLISCGNPAESSTTETTTTPITPTQSLFTSPEDEERTTKTFTVKNEDDIEMRVLFYGYKSETLGMDFYVKNGEAIETEIQIINRSQNTIYRYSSYACGGTVLGDEECGCEFRFQLQDDAGNLLVQDSSYCNSMLQAPTVLSVPSANSYRASSFVQDNIYLIAGIMTFEEEEIDIPVRNPLQQQEGVGFHLYGNRFYTDYINTFSGTIAFDYSYTGDFPNDRTIECPVSLDVVYTAEPSTPESTTVSTTETTEPTQTTASETTTEPTQTTTSETTTEPTQTKPDYFVAPAPEVKATKSFTKTSPDGIELTVTIHGYQCNLNSLDVFYIKSNEPVDVDLQVKNNSDSTIYQFYPSTPTEFPVIRSCINNIAIGGNGHLNLGQMYGFQDAIDIAELAPGESKVKSHTITVSSDAIFAAPLDNFGGHFYIQYGVDFENRQHFAYDIILSVLVSVAHVPETN